MLGYIIFNLFASVSLLPSLLHRHDASDSHTAVPGGGREEPHGVQFRYVPVWILSF